MSQSTRADTFKTSMKIETAVAECHLLTRAVLQVPPVEKDQQGYDNTLFPTYDPIVPPPPPPPPQNIYRLDRVKYSRT